MTGILASLLLGGFHCEVLVEAPAPHYVADLCDVSVRITNDGSESASLFLSLAGPMSYVLIDQAAEHAEGTADLGKASTCCGSTAQAVTLKPGESTTVSERHVFTEPGARRLGFVYEAQELAVASWVEGFLGPLACSTTVEVDPALSPRLRERYARVEKALVKSGLGVHDALIELYNDDDRTYIGPNAHIDALLARVAPRLDRVQQKAALSRLLSSFEAGKGLSHLDAVLPLLLAPAQDAALRERTEKWMASTKIKKSH